MAARRGGSPTGGARQALPGVRPRCWTGRRTEPGPPSGRAPAGRGGPCPGCGRAARPAAGGRGSGGASAPARAGAPPTPLSRRGVRGTAATAPPGAARPRPRARRRREGWRGGGGDRGGAGQRGAEPGGARPARRRRRPSAASPPPPAPGGSSGAGAFSHPHLVNGQPHGVAEGLQQRRARGAGGHGGGASSRAGRAGNEAGEPLPARAPAAAATTAAAARRAPALHGAVTTRGRARPPPLTDSHSGQPARRPAAE